MVSSFSPFSCIMSLFIFLSTFLFSNLIFFSSSQHIHTKYDNLTTQLQNFTAISPFHLINRRILAKCIDSNPYLDIKVRSRPQLHDEEYVTVTINGVLHPSNDHWVAMISPSHSDVSSCPLNAILYQMTGDLSTLPLLCHYPVKAQFLSKDPSYLKCKKKECKKQIKGGVCALTTCSATLIFHVINIRSDIEFVLFGGSFVAPCILKRSSSLSFANPKKPLYGHLSSIDSTGSSMRLTWVSGDDKPQRVQYADGKLQASQVTTFSQKDMCGKLTPSPAQDFGWHDPGFIHSAVMTGLEPSTKFSYRYGSNSTGWSKNITFKTPPAAGDSRELKFIAFGDMGKAPRDSSAEHYIQPGSLAVIKAIADEVSSRSVDSIFHIGDISYATGFLVEWDYFLHLIEPIASKIPYMTAIGNHERDFISSGSTYTTPDSGGECGVPYETYFPMPKTEKDKPWYSIEQGSVHFTVISTEHDWTINSEQFAWMKKDMAAVNRSRTPWLIFTGPMYSSYKSLFLPSVDDKFVKDVEPLLYKVDLALFGHVHNYERTCAVYQKKCKSRPIKDAADIDTYDNTNYSAPVHATIGMAGFSLDKFPSVIEDWSLAHVAEFGYVRIYATKEQLRLEFVNANTRKVEDSFRILKTTRP